MSPVTGFKLRRARKQHQAVSAPPPTPEAARKAAADADLAYKMLKWPRHLFNAECGDDGFLKEAVELRKEAPWTAMVRELFGRLYGNGTTPYEEVPEGNEWAGELHRQADAVPEWKQLEQRVHGDAWRAAMGAGQVAHLLAPNVPDLPEENAGAMQAEADMMAEVAGKRVNAAFMQQRAALQQRIAAARKTGAAAVDAMQAAHGFATRSALRRAAQGALDALDKADAGMQGLGCGVGTTTVQRRALMMQMASNPKLLEIAELAGRLRIQAARKQRTKTKQERSELVSVTIGDDMEHLLPCAVGMLALPESRLLVLDDISRKQALQYQLGGSSEKTRGPLVFLIDASGSMSGQREVWSKACAMAMLEIARIQKRPCALAYFDSEVKHATFFDPATNSPEKVLEVLGVDAIGGGTDIAQALRWANQVVDGKQLRPNHLVDSSGNARHEYVLDGEWKPGRNADVVLITDGADTSEKDEVCESLREKGATLYTIAIECAPPPDLKKHSAEALHLSAKDMVAASPKLDGVFAL